MDVDMKAPKRKFQETQIMLNPATYSVSLKAEKFQYLLPQMQSVIAEKSMKQSYFAQDSYAHTVTAVAVINSGSAFIDPHCSYLSFVLPDPSVTTATSASIKSIHDLIDQVTVYHKSGKELDRIENYSLYRNKVDLYRYKTNYFNGPGSLEGYADRRYAAPTSIDVLASTYDSVRWQIPLAKLCPIFDCERGKLIPPHLMTGMRIEIRWKTPADAFKTNAGTVDSYALNQIRFSLSSYQLQDRYIAELNKIAATKGLEWHWNSVFHTTFATGSQNNVLQITKKCSKLNGVHVVPQLDSILSTPTADADASVDLDLVASFQTRLGSQLYPCAPLENSREMFQNTLQYFGKTCYHSDCPLRVEDVTGGSTDGILSQTLERSAVLSISGQPVRSDRSLEVRLNFTGAVNRTTSCYLEFTKVARVTLQNVIVSE